MKSTLGAIEHSLKWLDYRSQHWSYQNPKFKVPENITPFLKKGIAIYLIPGTADYPSAFVHFAKKLIQLGLPEIISAIHIISFTQRFTGKSIEKHNQVIIEKIKMNGDTDIIFFGHSRGGLNAHKIAALAKDLEINVYLVASIATPYQGSYLAVKPLTLLSDSVAEMRVGKEYLKQVAEEVMQSETRYHFFVSKIDWIVEPRCCFVENYVKKYPDSLTEFAAHGHLSIMTSNCLPEHSIDLLAGICKKVVYDKQLRVAEFATTKRSLEKKPQMEYDELGNRECL